MTDQSPDPPKAMVLPQYVQDLLRRYDAARAAAGSNSDISTIIGLLSLTPRQVHLLNAGLRHRRENR